MNQDLLEIACYAVMGAGVFFCFAAVIGLVRFPNTYSRLHAGTKALTGGAMLILLGAAPLSGSPGNALRIILIVGFYLATNPLGTHAIARSCRLHVTYDLSSTEHDEDLN